MSEQSKTFFFPDETEVYFCKTETGRIQQGIVREFFTVTAADIRDFYPQFKPDDLGKPFYTIDYRDGHETKREYWAPDLIFGTEHEAQAHHSARRPQMDARQKANKEFESINMWVGCTLH